MNQVNRSVPPRPVRARSRHGQRGAQRRLVDGDVPLQRHGLRRVLDRPPCGSCGGFLRKGRKPQDPIFPLFVFAPHCFKFFSFIIRCF